MDRGAGEAINVAWQAFVHVRALCPSATESFIGATEYVSPGWYQQRGARYCVSLASPFTSDDLDRLREGTAFVNRSFIITMAVILEAYEVVPQGAEPDLELPGGEHVQLVKWLRNRFAHGDYEPDLRHPFHIETRDLLKKLLPHAPGAGDGFPASIDSVLEPLKDGVLLYIAAKERSA